MTRAGSPTFAASKSTSVDNVADPVGAPCGVACVVWQGSLAGMRGKGQLLRGEGKAPSTWAIQENVKPSPEVVE